MVDINVLVEELKTATSDIEILRLESKLSHLTHQIQENGGETAISLDAMLKDIEESRQRKRENDRRRLTLGNSNPFQRSGLGARIYRT
jgi:hypothetical protein